MFHLGVALLFVIAFNCSTELLTALRQVRAVSLLQLANSLIFTVVSLTLIAGWGMRSEGVVLGFSFANLVTAVAGIWVVRRCLVEEPDDAPTEGELPSTLWQKLAPFAAWFWLADLLGNLFSNVDRVMIVHFADRHGLDGLSLVGQYHSSQIIGILLVGLTGILGSVLLSYVSHDWEAGDRAKAAHTLDFAIKLTSLALTVGAAIGLVMCAAWCFTLS